MNEQVENTNPVQESVESVQPSKPVQEPSSNKRFLKPNRFSYEITFDDVDPKALQDSKDFINMFNGEMDKVLKNFEHFLNKISIDKVRSHRKIEMKVRNILGSLMACRKTVNAHKLHESDIDLTTLPKRVSK